MDKAGAGLRILLLEDVPSDAELEEIELRDAGLAYTLLRVETRAAFVQALDEFKPDIVLADYKLPDYSGRDALAYVRSTYPQIPVIMVTGVLGDEAAVELLKLGARDYVLKDHLPRLVPAINRALSEERGIRNRKLAEKKLRESEEKFRQLSDAAQDAIIMMDAEGKISFWNKAAQQIFGYTSEETLGQEMLGLLAPPSRYSAYERWFRHFSESSKGIVLGKVWELEGFRKGGIEFPVELSVSGVQLGGKWHSIGIVRDITGRKQAEERLKRAMFDLGERLKENHCLYAVSTLVANTETPVDQCMQHIVETLPPAMQFPGIACARLTLQGRQYTTAHFKETSWRLASDIPAGGEQAVKVEVFYLEERAVCDVGPFLREEVSLINAIARDAGDFLQRKQAVAALRRSNRALKTLSAGNLALVRSTSEDELLREATRLIVEQGGYRLAAVCYIKDDPEKSIAPMAWSGMDDSLYWMQQFNWAGTEQDQLPVSRAIHTGTPQICHDIASDPVFKPLREAALERGYVSTIALPLSSGGRTFGGLSIYSSDADAFDEEEARLLEELANDLSYGINALRTRAERDRAMEESHRYLEKISKNLEDTIQAIAATVEIRDPTTAGHEKRAAELSMAIGQELELDKEQLDGLRIAANVFDIGKIRIPAEILNKPGTLDEITLKMIQLHPETGYEILKGIDFPLPVATIVRQHHERLDGSGYPRGLKGSEILLEAQILAVADVVEAMTSHRPYRPSLGLDAALKEIMDNRGKLYSADVVDACIRLFREKGFAFS